MYATLVGWLHDINGDIDGRNEVGRDGEGGRYREGEKEEARRDWAMEHTTFSSSIFVQQGIKMAERKTKQFMTNMSVKKRSDGRFQIRS